jgi:hypothetical protein
VIDPPSAFHFEPEGAGQQYHRPQGAGQGESNAQLREQRTGRSKPEVTAGRSKTFFCRVFELPSPRNTRKRDKKVEEKLPSKFLSIVLGKVFDMDFLQKYFNSAF